jgi:hypothetical protein
VVPQGGHDGGLPVPGGRDWYDGGCGSVRRLAQNPYPAESFRWGDVLRLRVGRYRIMYIVEGELITIQRVDRVTAD